ncbi:hypothetical protein [Sphingobacterium micropteri]|nr:hypothetical protein [Sphingobacterium micropteri]
MMEKMNVKRIMQHLLFLLLVGMVTLSGCSKDDDTEQPDGKSIDIAVGTYKGKLTVWGDLPNTDQNEFFDAVITVTKADNEHLKVTAKTGEPYSAVTEKTIKVQAEEYLGDIYHVIGDLQGSFWYHTDTKTVDISTNKQRETDVHYTFEGAKQ